MPRRVAVDDIPPGTPNRVAGLMAEGRAEAITPDSVKIVALWSKAISSFFVRRLRTQSVYYAVSGTATDLGRVQRVALLALPEILAAILRCHPSLASQLSALVP